MEEYIKKVVELDIDLDDLELENMGVDVVSFVTDPAIEIDFMAFKSEEFDLDEACWEGYEPIGMKEKDGRMVPNCVPIQTKQEFESYNDYPESATNAARRALEWRDSHPEQSCGTQVGWTRANQLAKKENISEETIARMASFARHLQYEDVPYSEGCGGLMVDAWGGRAGIEWAQRKLEQIREEMEYNPSALPPYVDQDEEVKVKASCGCNHSFGDEEYTSEQRIILEWAEENGEVITEDYTYIKEGEQFNTVADVAKAIQGLDILSKLGITSGEPAERKYRYTGPTPERGFCRAMMRLNKMYSDADMSLLESKLSTVNPGMGPNGINTYDVFKYKGSVNCRHYWTQLAVFRPEGGSRVLVIDQGPAAGDAGKSNNANYPSPAGAVENNASLRRRQFGFSIMNDEKRIVAGPLMIPNKMILRRDENGEPYYVYFSVDTVKRIQERFNRDYKQNNTDTQHDGEILTDNIMLEQWLVEHPTYDKSRFYGFERLPMYTWFGVYKVNDNETWERVKSGELKSFSIAGNFIERAKKVNQDEQTLSKILDILSKIK